MMIMYMLEYRVQLYNVHRSDTLYQSDRDRDSYQTMSRIWNPLHTQMLKHTVLKYFQWRNVRIPRKRKIFQFRRMTEEDKTVYTYSKQ